MKTNNEMMKFTHDSTMTNIEHMNVYELTRLRFFMENMHDAHFDDEYGYTNAFFTNMIMTLQHRIDAIMNGEIKINE